jgi:hypothetical protein
LIGYGPLAEDVALALSQRGGPVYFIRHDSVENKALTAQALTPSAAGPAITITGTPNDRYALKVEIMLGGARGTATYRYSLDAHDSDAAPITWSQTRVSPSGGTYVIAGSGLTLNFPVGTYVLGETYTYETIPQEPGTVDLALVAAVVAALPALDLSLWHLSGSQPDETTGSAVAAALQAHLTTMTTSFRYMRGFCDVGSVDTAANVLTEAANWTAARVCPAYGFVLRSSLAPFEGFAFRKTSCVSGIGVRAMKVEISTDLARTADGPDEGVEKIFFDGFYTQTLDAVKISTMRTWPGIPGFFIANGNLKSAFGSDFQYVQHGRCMDVACRTTYVAQQQFSSDSLRTIGEDVAEEPSRPVGAIDERDAKSIEQIVQNSLDDALMRPNNARGVPGHVSEVVYAVDLSVNLITTGQLVTTVGIRPLGYAKVISTTLFFTLTP